MSPLLSALQTQDNTGKIAEQVKTTLNDKSSPFSPLQSQSVAEVMRQHPSSNRLRCRFFAGLAESYP